MTAPALALGSHPSVPRGVVLDALYLVAVIVAVVLGGVTQLALAVPVAGVLGLRAVHRRRTRHAA